MSKVTKMTRKRPSRSGSPRTRTPHDVLAREAADWDSHRRTPAEFDDAPEAVPRAQDATAISIRMPAELLTVLKRFAEREGIGYQVLIKRWLDDRIRDERERLREQRSHESVRARTRAPQFPLRDRNDGRGHYQHG